jgi:hypothetical protein
MCSIASLFLLQRLKESMSGEARDFNNIETRAFIRFGHAKALRKLGTEMPEPGSRRQRCRWSGQRLTFFRLARSKLFSVV